MNERKKKIDEVCTKITDLKRELARQEEELSRLFVRNYEDYTGKYIEYDGNYMKVERQYTEGTWLTLAGPRIMIDSTLDDDDEISVAEYERGGEIFLDMATMKGVGPLNFHVIDKETFITVLDAVRKTLVTDFGL